MSLDHRPNSSLALAAILVTLAACSQQAQQSASADPTVEVTASPSPTPEPTLAPADAFVAFLTEDRFTATADLSGTLAVNDEATEMSGTWTVSGADFHLILNTGETGRTVEQAVVDGQNFTRRAPMPWTRDIQASVPSDDDVASLLAALPWKPPRGAGIGEAELVASGTRIEAVMTLLGLVDQTVEVDSATLTVHVDRRGVPTDMRVEAAVHPAAGDPMSIEWDLVYAFHDVGRLTTVEKPEVWLQYESRLGYSMHHPESWSVSLEPGTAEYRGYDLYLSGIGGELHVTLLDNFDLGILADALLQSAATNFSDHFGAPEEVESLMVAGAPAMLFAAHASDEVGEWWVTEVAIVGEGRAWDIVSWAAPGTETEARETLDQFLATFEIAEQ